MKELKYSVKIAAPRDKVWAKMTEADSYRAWAKAFSPNSQFEGEWKQGAKMKFFDPDMGGTVADLTKIVPGQHIHAEHVALLKKDGTSYTDGEMADKWIGATETYSLEEKDGATELHVRVKTHEDFAAMFDGGWPTALETLKGLCE